MARASAYSVGFAAWALLVLTAAGAPRAQVAEISPETRLSDSIALYNEAVYDRAAEQLGRLIADLRPELGSERNKSLLGRAHFYYGCCLMGLGRVESAEVQFRLMFAADRNAASGLALRDFSPSIIDRVARIARESGIAVEGPGTPNEVSGAGPIPYRDSTAGPSRSRETGSGRQSRALSVQSESDPPVKLSRDHGILAGPRLEKGAAAPPAEIRKADPAKSARKSQDTGFSYDAVRKRIGSALLKYYARWSASQPRPDSAAGRNKKRIQPSPPPPQTPGSAKKKKGGAL